MRCNGRGSRSFRDTFFPAIVCLKYSGHCTRPLPFLSWGKKARQVAYDDVCWQPSLTGKMTWSQTNQGVRGVCVGVLPCFQSKLSHAHHAHRGKKLLPDLQTLENTVMRALVRFREAREKRCHGICGIPGGLTRRHDGRPSVERGLRQEPGTALSGDTCWSDVSWQWLPTRNHPPLRYILHKDGMDLSYP